MGRGAHGGDLRKGRYSEAGRIYLVTAVTEARQALFVDIVLGRELVHAMRHHDLAGDSETLAFVVMPDHFHWLFALGESISLAPLIKSVKSFSARRINQRLGSSGSRVWQTGYHDHALRRDEDLVHVSRYVVANPLRAGLVERLGDYPLWDAAFL
jgi:REP element-mobilizing transposase RayT